MTGDPKRTSRQLRSVAGGRGGGRVQLACGGMDTRMARRTWRVLEPVHSMVYFVPERIAEYGAIGVTDQTMSYFGSRAAPMGAVGAEIVVATFFNFSPELVRQFVPAV